MSETPDAFFERRDGKFVCVHCDKPIDDHQALHGMDEFTGWTRYRCIGSEYPQATPEEIAELI